MAHELEHEWAVVAPWWKWPSPSDTVHGRTTSPAIQKYDSANLVNQFLANPQRCLKRVREDFVHGVKTAVVPFDKSAPKLPRRLGSLNDKGEVEVFDPADVDSPLLKIFLDTHKRFYLIVCSLHCDASGFPKVGRGQVCEAGFVVRRRVTEPADGALLQARKAFGTARDELRVIDAELARERALHLPAQSALRVLMAERRTQRLVRRRGFAEERLAAERDALQRAIRHFGNDKSSLQGWFPHLGLIRPAGKPDTAIGAAPLENLGVWSEVDEEPTTVGDETTFPLYPLVPPPSAQRHAGQFGTIYFGVLPTGGRDTDPTGRPRFDDKEQYEVRCFARRHFKAHAKGSPCPCPGETFWSLPTEPYKLASHFDLIGTSHQPVVVQLPDLKELAAQAAPVPGVGFAMPKGYPMVTGEKDGTPKKLGASPGEICFFPIPLITIVAKFLFEIFLPVVMFVFGLFWMLKLKFCIPPSVGADFDMSGAATVNGRFDVNAGADLKVALAGDITTTVKNDLGDPVGAELATLWSPIALGNMELDRAAAGKNPPTVTASREFEAEVAYA